MLSDQSSIGFRVGLADTYKQFTRHINIIIEEIKKVQKKEYINMNNKRG